MFADTRHRFACNTWKWRKTTGIQRRQKHDGRDALQQAFTYTFVQSISLWMARHVRLQGSGLHARPLILLHVTLYVLLGAQLKELHAWQPATTVAAAPSLEPLSRLTFDAKFYINLAHRVDRRQEMEAELRKWGWLNSTARIEGLSSLAVRVRRWLTAAASPLAALFTCAGSLISGHGALGCTRSHIGALRQFLADPTLKHVLVMEDDIAFTSDPSEAIDRFLRDHGNHGWDALMVAVNAKVTRSHGPYLARVLVGLTTAAYAVTRETAMRLLPIFEESERRQMTRHHSGDCLDRMWEPEQASREWYTFLPKLAVQRDGFSDIMNKNVSYGV